MCFCLVSAPSCFQHASVHHIPSFLSAAIHSVLSLHFNDDGDKRVRSVRSVSVGQPSNNAHKLFPLIAQLPANNSVVRSLGTQRRSQHVSEPIEVT